MDGAQPRARVKEVLRRFGVTVMTDAKTGLTIMRKGPKRLVLEQMHKMIGQSELRYLARTFEFDWMYFHFDQLEFQIPEKSPEH